MTICLLLNLIITHYSNMELFDFIKFLFTTSDDKDWFSLSSYEKAKNQFMLNRIMSIGFPVNAMQLNKIKTDGLGVVEVWRMFAGRFYGNRVPKFIYTKTNKLSKDKSPIAGIPKECIDIWCEKYECGDREFNEVLKINPEGLVAELEYIKKFIEKDKTKEDDER